MSSVATCCWTWTMACCTAQVKVAEAALVEARAALAKLPAGVSRWPMSRRPRRPWKAEGAGGGRRQPDERRGIRTVAAQVSMTHAHYAEVASHPTAAEKLAAQAAIAQAEAALPTRRPRTTWSRVIRPSAPGPSPWGSARPRPHWKRRMPRRRLRRADRQRSNWRWRQRPSARRKPRWAAQRERSGSRGDVRAAWHRRPARRRRWTNCWQAPRRRTLPWPTRGSAQAEVESAKARLAENQVYAPFDGKSAQSTYGWANSSTRVPMRSCSAIPAACMWRQLTCVKPTSCAYKWACPWKSHLTPCRTISSTAQ